MLRANCWANLEQDQKAQKGWKSRASPLSDPYCIFSLGPVHGASPAFSWHKGNIAPTCYIWVDSKVQWTNTYILLREWKMAGAVLLESESRRSVCGQFCVNILPLFGPRGGAQAAANAGSTTEDGRIMRRSDWQMGDSLAEIIPGFIWHSAIRQFVVDQLLARFPVELHCPV